MKITKRQLRRIIKEEKTRLLSEQELKKGQYGYEGADQAAYDKAYNEIMFVVSELGYAGPQGAPEPTVQAAIYNALTEIAKELETEMESNKKGEGPSSDWEHHYGGRR